MMPRADDLIPEESDVVQQAIKRLPPKEAYDRVFRLRRAFQVRLKLHQNHIVSLSTDICAACVVLSIAHSPSFT
jgi:ubiquinol-cytochrome C reductase complex subunit VI